VGSGNPGGERERGGCWTQAAIMNKTFVQESGGGCEGSVGCVGEKGTMERGWMDVE